MPILELSANMSVGGQVLDLDNNKTENLAKQLRSYGITPTRQRLDIAAILLCKPQHLAAEQILTILKEVRGQASKATVYNTLRLFSKKGLIRAVVVDPSRVFYDSTAEAHHHLYDVDSGELLDIPPQDMRFERLPQLPEGVKTTGIDVIVRVRREDV